MLTNERDSDRELKLLRWQTELARIDQEWKQQEESFLITWRYGFRSLPAKSSAEPILGVVIGSGFIVVGISDFIQSRTFPLAILCGFLLIMFTLIAGARTRSKRHSYEQAKTAYEQRRAELLQRKPQ